MGCNHHAEYMEADAELALTGVADEVTSNLLIQSLLAGVIETTMGGGGRETSRTSSNWMDEPAAADN
jgi:hypothetical protein